MNYNIDDFGVRLLSLIKQNNLTQSAFANRLCASPSFISDLIRGVKKPGTEILIRIKNNFVVNIDWLLFGGKDLSEKGVINAELLKAIALRVVLIRAVLADDKKAINIFSRTHKNNIDELLKMKNMGYQFDSAKIANDIDIVLDLYNQYASSSLDDSLYEQIAQSAISSIVNTQIDPLLKTE